MENPRIFIGCLAAYNNGLYHGKWVNADCESFDELQHELDLMISQSPIKDASGDYAIFDFENFGSYELGEYSGIQNAYDAAHLVNKHGELIGELVQMFHLELNEIDDFIDEHLVSISESDLAFSQDLFDEMYFDQIPNSARAYIDYEGFCRDIFIDSYTSIDANNKTYIFSNY